jgi:hypothetical protein
MAAGQGSRDPVIRSISERKPEPLQLRADLMRALLLSLMLVQAAEPANATTTPKRPSTQSYKTAKSVAAIEQCLVQELSDLGDPTFMRTVDNTTLMIRNGEAKPLLIDIAPPTVTITTNATYETQVRVKRCV